MFFSSRTHGTELSSPWSRPHNASEQWVTFNSPYHYSNSVEFSTIVWDLQVCVCGCQHCQTYHNCCICTIILPSVRCKKNPQMDDNSTDSWQVTSPADVIRVGILGFSVKSFVEIWFGYRHVYFFFCVQLYLNRDLNKSHTDILHLRIASPGN